jgi:hypothetical protein
MLLPGRFWSKYNSEMNVFLAVTYTTLGKPDYPNYKVTLQPEGTDGNPARVFCRRGREFLRATLEEELGLKPDVVDDALRQLDANGEWLIRLNLASLYPPLDFPLDFASASS